MKRELKTAQAHKLLIETFDAMFEHGFCNLASTGHPAHLAGKVDWLVRASDEFVIQKEGHNGETWAIPPHLMLARIAVLTASALGGDRQYQKVVIEQTHQIISVMREPSKRVAYLDDDEWTRRVDFACLVMTGQPS